MNKLDLVCQKKLKQIWIFYITLSISLLLTHNLGEWIYRGKKNSLPFPWTKNSFTFKKKNLDTIQKEYKWDLIQHNLSIKFRTYDWEVINCRRCHSTHKTLIASFLNHWKWFSKQLQRSLIYITDSQSMTLLEDKILGVGNWKWNQACDHAN